MMRKLLITGILFLPLLAAAQTVVTGGVYDQQRRSIPLEGAIITNIKSQRTAQSDKSGRFTLQANTGDLLQIKLSGYRTDTVYLPNLLPKFIYLTEQATSLRDVEIKGARLAKGIGGTDPEAEEFRRVGTGGNLNRKANDGKIGGLNLNLGYGKYRRAQKKEAELDRRSRLYDEINYSFNEQTVANVINTLKGQDLKDFIAYYKPRPEDVSGAQKFDYNAYIVDSYNEWVKLTPEQRKQRSLPKLDSN
ncbi:hypothetical protein C7T94_00170 [Pedobacter yulinensis]|uniref:Carboxypeptidase-like regulatory domain-containing protein n=1 Tax=Pedobacter yulinensis TaxID=2126353 RepID=A0A2T3HQC3_9SPHI|nr:hypothetical protein [Pedobacter yulinensis]PST84591.1 hypothetical protein C7T94_00170 [Pedobacter yulinensis]